jgi:hypothetical protein
MKKDNNDVTKKSISLIEAAIQNLRATLNEQLARLEENLKYSSGDVHTKVAERKSLARNLALDKKLTEIWEEYRICEIEDPQEHKLEHEIDVSFLLNGNGYKFTYRDDGGNTLPDGEYFHHTRLSLRDTTNRVLIEINISVDFQPYGNVLEPFDVSAFVVGDWIQDFLLCYERLQAKKKEQNIRQTYDSKKIAELKNRFDID